MLPLPGPSSVSAPAPVRKKIPQMPPSPPSQATESDPEQISSTRETEAATEPVSVNPNVETQVVQLNQSVAEAQETTAETVAANQNEVETTPSAPPTQPIESADEKEVVNESQSVRVPAPAAPVAEEQPASPSAEASPAPVLPQSNNEAVPQATEPPKPQEPEVEATAAAEPAEEPPKSDSPAPFNVQVGAYLTGTYADDKMNALKKLGYDAFIFQSTDARKRTWYAVRFGWFTTREEALRALSVFKAKEGMDGIVSRSDAL